ncbi:MAG: cyclic-phosphate processing receiver domain-containing protein [Anaerolineaceae bacterium]
MTWTLFIDDERIPEDVTWVAYTDPEIRDFEVARNISHVVELLAFHGSMPDFISFDHDLGDHTASGAQIAKFLIALDMADQHDLYFYGSEVKQEFLKILDDNRSKFRFSSDFKFVVHSQNPVGKQNIEGILRGYLQHHLNRE